MTDQDERDRGYAKGYQAALDDLKYVVLESINQDRRSLQCRWLLDKIQELKEKADDRQ